MSREDYIAVAVRLLAIYVLFGILKSVPMAAQMISQQNGAMFAGLYVAILIAGAGTCVLLWKFPLTVARKLLPVMKEARSEEAVSGPVALSVGITLIGLWFLVSALIDASYWVAVALASRQVGDGDMPLVWDSGQIASMVAVAFQILVSTWLIFGNAGIRRLIDRFRYGDALTRGDASSREQSDSRASD